jgi:hypothetical protein
MRSASGIIISLPHDHTAKSVNTAVTAAFAAMPAHMKRTLTWDQGVEMARHQELTAATGVPVFFAERSSPWQRGANETTTGSSVSISRREPIWQSTHPSTSPTSPGSSATAPEKASATTPRQPDSPPKHPPHQPAEIASQARSKCPHDTQVLRRLVESAARSSGISSVGSYATALTFFMTEQPKVRANSHAFRRVKRVPLRAASRALRPRCLRAIR